MELTGACRSSPKRLGLLAPGDSSAGPPQDESCLGVYDGGGRRADMFRQSYFTSLIVLMQLPVLLNLQVPTGRKSHAGEYLRVHFMPH